MKDQWVPRNHQWIRQAVQQHERPLVCYATRLTGNLAQGQEIAQETFLRLCRQPEQIEEPKLKAWLYTVCRNHALDTRRKEKRMTRTHETPVHETPSTTMPPSTPAEQAETHGQVLDQLALLPENQQEVLRLKFRNDLSYKQIAQVTGLTVGHVGYLIHTGLKNMRQRLASAIG